MLQAIKALLLLSLATYVYSNEAQAGEKVNYLQVVDSFRNSIYDSEIDYRELISNSFSNYNELKISIAGDGPDILKNRRLAEKFYGTNYEWIFAILDFQTWSDQIYGSSSKNTMIVTSLLALLPNCSDISELGVEGTALYLQVSYTSCETNSTKFGIVTYKRPMVKARGSDEVFVVNSTAVRVDFDENHRISNVRIVKDFIEYTKVTLQLVEKIVFSGQDIVVHFAKALEKKAIRTAGINCWDSATEATNLLGPATYKIGYFKKDGFSKRFRIYYISNREYEQQQGRGLKPLRGPGYNFDDVVCSLPLSTRQNKFSIAWHSKSPNECRAPSSLFYVSDREDYGWQRCAAYSGP